MLVLLILSRHGLTWRLLLSISLSPQMADLQTQIEAAWANRILLQTPETKAAIEHVIEELDKGRLRVATPPAEDGGEWTINE